MTFEDWKYECSNGDYKSLEPWMRFCLELGSYVKQESEIVKIYISVPSSQPITYFITLGAINFDFNHPSREKLLERYLDLQHGQRINYESGQQWRAYSVLAVTNMPNKKEVRAIKVRDRLNSIRFIPESRWLSHIIVADDDISEIRNTRQVSNLNQIVENGKLKGIYGKENLELLMMKNTPDTHLYTNRLDWLESRNLVNLDIEGYRLRISELIYDGTDSDFKNITFIQKDHSRSYYSESSTIIFNGGNRALRKMDEFYGKKCIYIIDQHESEENFRDLNWKIEQSFLLSKPCILNKRLLNYMQNKNVEIPRGVEIFAWCN